MGAVDDSAWNTHVWKWVKEEYDSLVKFPALTKAAGGVGVFCEFDKEKSLKEFTEHLTLHKEFRGVVSNVCSTPPEACSVPGDEINMDILEHMARFRFFDKKGGHAVCTGGLAKGLQHSRGALRDREAQEDRRRALWERWCCSCILVGFRPGNTGSDRSEEKDTPEHRGGRAGDLNRAGVPQAGEELPLRLPAVPRQAV